MGQIANRMAVELFFKAKDKLKQRRISRQQEKQGSKKSNNKESR